MEKKRWQLFGLVVIVLVILIAGSIVKGAENKTKTPSETYSNARNKTQPATASKPTVPQDVNSKTISNEKQETARVDTSKNTAVEPSDSNQYRSLKEILNEEGNPEGDGMTIVVQKRDHLLSLYLGSQKLKSYHVELGDNGLGDKEARGDHKTPEGIFYVAEKSVLNPPDEFLGTRWMRLSYPNIEDAKRGLTQGIIDQGTSDAIVSAIRNGVTPPQDTALGGGVGIHGGTAARLGPNWTWGCVGLTNQDVNEFYDYVKVGTPVVIRN